MPRLTFPKRLKICSSFAIVPCFFALLANTVGAALITDSTSLVGSTVIDFSQFSGAFQFTQGPVQIGGLVGRNVTWESTNSKSVIGNDPYGLGHNGRWDEARNGYTGTNSDTAVMTYRFLDGPISGVGGFLNYATGDSGLSPDAFIYALDAQDQILESYNLVQSAPISTRDANDDGAFRGILRNSADIYAFRLSNTFSVLDNLTFNDVPEPSTFVLAAFGSVGLGTWMLRRRTRRARPVRAQRFASLKLASRRDKSPAAGKK